MTRKLLGTTLFAATFAGALGFGATQAVASPEAANWTTLPVRRSMPAQCRFW